MTKVRVIRTCLLLLLAPTVAATGADGNSWLFPFPMIEAERVITRWLVDSGYRITAEESGLGEKRVNAQRAAEEWQILLKPSSPLYTEVVARCLVAGAGDAARLQALRALLDNHARDSRPTPVVSRTVPAVANGGPPEAVLRHQEAIICLENGPGSGRIQLSGFVCDESGLILTTAHDLFGHAVLTVVTKDGQRFHGRAAKLDHLRDLALVQAGFKPGHAISPSRGRLNLDRGETIYAMGCPQGTLGSLYMGTVNSPPRLANAMPLWQVSMTVLPGSSGSPVFDARGNLVGVIKGRYRGTDSIGFLIPVSIVLEFLGR